jgi:hypothetical protein
MDIDGVEVKQPIFVVEHCNNDLILGRPWERLVGVESINENDSPCTVRIKSLDNHRIVQFCTIKAEYKRNHEFARHADGAFDNRALKA